MKKLELLLENAVLLAEIVDHGVLLTADPAGQCGDEDLPRLQSDSHSLIVARQRGIRQLSIAVPTGLFFPRIFSAEKVDNTGAEAVVRGAFVRSGTTRGASRRMAIPMSADWQGADYLAAAPGFFDRIDSFLSAFSRRSGTAGAARS